MNVQTSVLSGSYRGRAAGLAPAGGSRAAAIAKLRVWHRPIGGELQEGGGLAQSATSALTIATCQRQIRIVLSDAPEPSASCQGEDAYRLLLEFAAGLKSAIPGETNVFGQVREAWRVFEQHQPRATVRAFAPFIDALFRDVRAVRTHFLQGIGGQSYATLARRLLAPQEDSRVLIVGYGELGRGMPDKFVHSQLGLYNRSALAQTPRHVTRLFAVGEERAAASWATHVVLCIPRAADCDAAWVEALRSQPGQRVVHLGCRRADRGPWAALAGLLDLDDLFDLQRSQDERRASQLQFAREACRLLAERAVSPALL